jgi:hypothetical protein
VVGSQQLAAIQHKHNQKGDVLLCNNKRIVFNETIGQNVWRHKNASRTARFHHIFAEGGVERAPFCGSRSAGVHLSDQFSECRFGGIDG